MLVANTDKIWAKLDSENNGYIETAKVLTDAIAFLSILYRVKQYQKQTQSKEKPEINNPDSSRSCL